MEEGEEVVRDIQPKEWFIALGAIGLIMLIVAMYMLCSIGWATFITGFILLLVGLIGFMLALDSETEG